MVWWVSINVIIMQRLIIQSAQPTSMDIEGLRAGHRGSVARAITIVENRSEGAEEMLRSIYPETGHSDIVGITGPAGAGKSSLINGLAVEMARSGDRPAVLAVDPTSHITGGAILGDRVRMTSSTDSGIYIRSIASRGATGAISDSLRNSIRILDYAGFDPIIIESVGAGQTEVDISNIADVTVVVFNPHTGDSIQTIKAGITEIGDICVINKADLPGSSALYDAVRDYIGESDRSPAVLKTSVKEKVGIDELVDAIRTRLRAAVPSAPQRRAWRLEAETKDIVLNRMRQRLDMMLAADGTAHDLIKSVQDGSIDPYEAAKRICGMWGDVL